MADQYLEPIDDTVDLKAKFVGGPVTAETAHAAIGVAERPVVPEAASERASTYNRLMARVQSKKAANDDTSDASDDHAHTVTADAKATSAHLDVETQVRHLLELAHLKGPAHAVRVAQRMSDFYILDTMHDRMLVEQLHTGLKEKGMA